MTRATDRLARRSGRVARAPRAFGRVDDALAAAVAPPATSLTRIALRWAWHIVRVWVQVILIGASLYGAATVTWTVMRLPDHPDADISHFMHWTRLIGVQGMDQAYNGVYPETYLIYPPGSAWVYRGAIEFATQVAKPADLSLPTVATDWMAYLATLVVPAPPATDAPAEPPGEMPAEPSIELPAETPAPELPAAPSPEIAPNAPVDATPIDARPILPSTPLVPEVGGRETGSTSNPAPDRRDGTPTSPAFPPDAAATPDVTGPPDLPSTPESGSGETGPNAPFVRPGGDQTVPIVPDEVLVDGDQPEADAPTGRTDRSGVRTSQRSVPLQRLAYPTVSRSSVGEGDPPQTGAGDPVPADAEGASPPDAARVRPPAVRSIPGVDDAWLRIAVKLMPVIGHFALAISLFVVVAVVSRRFWRGWLAMSAYVWNPGPIFDTAYWGQGDTIHTCLLVLTIGVLFLFPGWWPLRRRSRWRFLAQAFAPIGGAVAGVLTALAALTKPQAWVFLPFVLWLVWRRSGPFGLGAFVTAAVAATVAVIRPWRDAGTLDDALSVFGALTQVMPSVSANGHNLWWIKLGPGALAVFDSLPVGGIGPYLLPGHLTFATLGRLGFGAFALLAALRLTGTLNVRVAMTAFAWVASSYFMTITQVHENHQFAAVPFLAAVAALDLVFLPILLSTSLVMFVNMASHDFLWGDSMVAYFLTVAPWLDRYGIVDAPTMQMANAWLNVGTFALFGLIFLFRPGTPEQSARYLVWRARFTLLAGLALAGGTCGLLWALVHNRAVTDAAWTLFTSGTRAVPLIDRHLGIVTTADARLGRAAVEFINIYYLLGMVAIAVGWSASVAGAIWTVKSIWVGRRERFDQELVADAIRLAERRAMVEVDSDDPLI